MQSEGKPQLGDLKDIIRRRGKLVAGVAVGVTLATYWIAMALPDEYMSYASVLVEPQAVDPDLVEAGVAGADLAERLNLMTARILSRSRLSRIIDELDLYPEESQDMVRQQVIDLMRSKVSVAPVVPELMQDRRNEDFQLNTFQIKFRDKRARTAAEVAQRLANDFIESHIEERVNLSQKSLEFIEGELRRLATRIEAAESAIAQVKNENPGRLPEDMLANQRQLERLMTAQTIALRSFAEATSDETFYRSQSASVARLDGAAGSSSPGERIQLLELFLADLAARGFTAKHPDVIKTRIEIEEVRAQLESAAVEDSENGKDRQLSFAAQSAEAEARRAGLRREAGEEELRRLEELLNDISARLAATPSVAEQLDALEREYQHLFASFQDFSGRRLEAMVQAQLERRSLGERFRVLEEAYESEEPTSPNRPMLIALGVVLGLGMGVGLGFLLESFDQSIHSAQQLQSALRIPVLASIPDIVFEVDRARLRRRRIRQALATGFVVVFALVGGFANYLWVNGSLGRPGAPQQAVEQAPADAAEANQGG